tara:strand:+ start:436792 stop:439923 length:3132 start_codon:yes stop_codon:yes gene_type:complete
MIGKIKGYIPYLVIVFLNAFVDLGHKIVIQNAIFKTYDGQQQVVLTALVNSLILLPFILLFSPSGYLSDKWPKQRIIRYSALFAIGATLLITLAYYQGWFWIAFGLTFALAVQSAIYSPAKYGYIKELVGNSNLASANGAVQAITIAGILLGTFLFSMLFEWMLPDTGSYSTDEIMRYIAPVGWLLVMLSVLEWIMTAWLPGHRQVDTALHFDLGEYLQLRYLRTNLGVISRSKVIWLSIVGLATFWAISQVMLAAFPAFAKAALLTDDAVTIQGILACSGIGIALGSVLAGRVSRQYIETGLIPLGALGIALGIALLPLMDTVIGMVLVFLGVGFMGGLFIVPLNALIQFHARESEIGTVLAGNNWIQNLAMMSALVLTVAFASAGIDSVGLFAILTVVAIVGTGYTVRQLPHSLVRMMVAAILKRRYRFQVIGFEHIPQAGATLLLGNHISWIDWALVQIACPRPIRFVMLRRIYDTWYLKPFLRAFGVVPIEPGKSEQSLIAINRLLKAGECVCLFPEGAISRNGQLGRFHTGYQRTLNGVESGVIVPFYLHGLWGSSLSRADEGLRRARRPDVKRDLFVAFGPPLPLATGAAELKQAVLRLSHTAWQHYSASLPAVPSAWLRSARQRPSDLSVADSGGARYTNREMAVSVACLARQLGELELPQRIGLLLPPSADAAQTMMALQLLGRSVVPLSVLDTTEALQQKLSAAGATQLITSRLYASQNLAQDAAADASLSPLTSVYLEDISASGPLWRRAMAVFLFYLLPVSMLCRLWGRAVSTDNTAVVLFDDSERGKPVPVLLSHRNVMVNCKQMADMLNMQVDDVLLSTMPVTHPMGLGVGTLLPLIEGVPVVCHGDVSDTVGMARAVARFQVTLLPASCAMLDALASHDDIHPLLLDSLRLVIANGLGLPQRTQDEFRKKFARPVYTGLGLAQATTAITVNVPDAIDLSDWKVQRGELAGSVGLPLPGTLLKVTSADGEALPCNKPGELWVCGEQVMLGYAGEPDHPATSISLDQDGLRWLHTGIRATLSDDGFLCVQG